MITSAICSESAFQKVENIVTRTEAIAKLRELKLQFDSFYPHEKQKLSFFNLLEDAAYRESSLLKLSYAQNAKVRDYANNLLEMNIQGSLFSDTPDLGADVSLKLYPVNSMRLHNIESIKLSLPSIRFLFYGTAKN